MLGVLLLSAAIGFDKTQQSKPDADTAAFLQASHAARLKELERLRARLKDRTIRLLKKEAAETRKRIKELEKPKSLFIPTLESRESLQVGTFGQVPASGLRVVQVIDEQNMLAELRFVVEELETVDNLVIPRAKSVARLVWVRGIETGELADREVVNSSEVFRVIEMKVHETADGSRVKVPLIEPFDISPAIKAFNAAR